MIDCAFGVTIIWFLTSIFLICLATFYTIKMALIVKKHTKMSQELHRKLLELENEMQWYENQRFKKKESGK